MESRKEEIYHRLVKLMDDLFEIGADQLGADAHLQEELGLDSIDTVDLMIALDKYLGRKIKPEEFKHVRTVGDVVETVFKLKYS